ncbi:hypothetical protein FGO68_gene5616 [Halteria grandinella]|uniref:Uncharacterized protein n=1 Tax=Halteria grandinella TaxID=5974 RepID=A0A8J8NNX2_HALGN|nr:hypothetical protein FGO68_gene5616 [Halteria grandinella]
MLRVSAGSSLQHKTQRNQLYSAAEQDSERGDNRNAKIAITGQTGQHQKIVQKKGIEQGRVSQQSQRNGEELVHVENLSLSDGTTYTGQILKHRSPPLKHGFGLQLWKDGARYEGDWLNGKANGKGTFYHLNGDIYEGDFIDDRANGNGVYFHKNGSKYTGEWKNDLKDGRGREEWEDGAYYEGDFREGRKHGVGTYLWSDGSTYSGGWSNNNIDGRGKYVWPDGRSYEGGWSDNKLHGQGMYVWPDGRKYEGSYVDDQKEGYGIYYWPDGKRYEGQWRNGKQHGEGKIVNAKGKQRRGIWEDGNRLQWIDGSSKRDHRSSFNGTMQGGEVQSTFQNQNDSLIMKGTISPAPSTINNHHQNL